MWAAGTRLTIEKLNDAGEVTDTIFGGPVTAEINSAGAGVYGYNWGSQGRKSTPSAGTCLLTFTTQGDVTIEGIADAAGLNVPTFTAHSTTLTVTLRSTHGGTSHRP